MLVCRAPTYPPKTGPTKKKWLPFWESFYFLIFSLNADNKDFFKIIKSCILIEQRLQRLLLYVFLPYIAFVDL